MPLLLSEVVVSAIPIFALAWFTDRLHPGKPWMHFVSTTLMALSSHYHFWTQSYGTTVSALMQPADAFESHVLHFALAYMLADFVFMAFFVQNLSMRDRIMYVVHHAAAASCIGQSLQSGRYGRLMFFSITCEISNIFLNGRELVPVRMSTVRLLVDGMFVLLFVGYRLLYQIPIILVVLYNAWKTDPALAFSELHGSIVLLGLHVWWTYLVVLGILQVVYPKRNESVAAVVAAATTAAGEQASAIDADAGARGVPAISATGTSARVVRSSRVDS